MNLKNAFLKLFVTGTRLLLGFLFFTAGMGKLTNNGFFPITFFPGSLEKILEPYGLGLWGRFVAWSQVIIGLLLLSQRFATIGAIMSLPLIANIFVITVSMRWQGTPYINAFFLTLNLLLLAADYHKLKFLFFDDANIPRETPLRRNHAKIDLLWLAGVTFAVAAPFFHKISRTAMFALAALGIMIFLACGVWQFLLERKKMA